MCNFRIGHGYDVHRLTPGRKLVLGGVDIPFELGLLGHSDADVLLHAVMDAVLGALGEGDIGRHFSDTDSAYKDISSMKLAAECRVIMHSRGYRISNIDSTLIAQNPRLSPFIAEMRRNIASVFNTSEDNVNVKATTEEGLGFTGCGEGIAAHCVVILEKCSQ